MPQGFESYSERVQREHLEALRLKVGDQLNVDYNRATEVLRLKAQTGLPEQLIDADFDNISEKVRHSEFDPNEYKRSAPAWRRFASENPMHLAVLKHDEEALTQFERAYRQMDETTAGEAFWSHTRDVMRSMTPIRNAWQSSWASNEMMLINARAQKSGGYTPGDEAKLDELRKYQASHNFGAEWSAPIVWLTKQSANMIGSMEQRFERGVEFGAAGAAMGGAYGAAGGSFIVPGLGTVTGGLGGAAGGWTVGFTGGMFFGGYEYGQELGRGEAYGEYRELGFNHEDAAWAAEISGHISGALEATLGQVFFDKLPGVRAMRGTASQQIIKQLMGKESFQQVARRAATDYGLGVTSEIVTEVLQESTMITMGEILKMRDPTVAERLSGEEIAGRIGEIALETLKSTFLIAGAGPGQRLIMDGRRARNAQNFSTVLTQMAEGAQKADLPKNLPDHWKAFVERVSEGGESEFIQMPVQEFIDFWASKGVDAETAANELGISNLEDAKLTGQDVRIPMAKFASKIAVNGETFNQMLPNLRPHDEAMTLREAEEYIQQREKMMELLEEYSAKVRDTEQDAEIEDIVNDVQGQLVSAGYDEYSASQLATVMRGIGIMAREEGMDPKPLYEQIFGGVRRVTEGEKTKSEDVDVFIDPLLDRLRNRDFPSQRDMYGPSLMDFVVASGGIDIGDPELVAMDFELGAQDLGVSKARLARWKKGGKTTADIAEIAAEAGYIPANDENQLIEALREELGGRPVYGTRSSGDIAMRDLSVTLDDLQQILDVAGIDLETMTNAEVRKALDERRTLAQIDTKDLQDLTQLVLSQVGLSETMSVEAMYEMYGGPDQIDTILAQAASMLPDVDETQDFGDVRISDTVRLEETGKRAKVKPLAQREFDKAVKRKNVLKRLLDCVSG